jgi:hypothetical protein
LLLIYFAFFGLINKIIHNVGYIVYIKIPITGIQYKNLCISIDTFEWCYGDVCHSLYPCRRNNTAVLFGVALFETNTSVRRFVFPPEDANSTSYIAVEAADLRRPRSVGRVLDSVPAAFLFPPHINK